MTLALIERLTKVFKDYCGVLTEESIKKNFTLIYELLDEVIVSASIVTAGFRLLLVYPYPLLIV